MTKSDLNTDVVIRARNGEPGALTTFYERYGRTVYRTALRLMKSPQDAEDVLQDVFLGLPEKLHTYAALGSLEGWIRRVAMRTALMNLRTRRSLGEVSLMCDCAHPGVRASERSIVDRLAVEHAVARLPETQRTVVVLKEFEGLSHEEVAKLIGISNSASRARYHRAMRTLRRVFEGSQ